MLFVLVFVLYLFVRAYCCNVVYCMPRLTIDVDTANSILKKVPAPFAEQIAHLQAGVGSIYNVEYLGGDLASVSNVIPKNNWIGARTFVSSSIIYTAIAGSGLVAISGNPLGAVIWGLASTYSLAKATGDFAVRAQLTPTIHFVFDLTTWFPLDSPYSSFSSGFDPNSPLSNLIDSIPDTPLIIRDVHTTGFDDEGIRTPDIYLNRTEDPLGNTITTIIRR